MAIITPTGGSLIPQVVATTLLAPGAQTQPVATTATNNRKRARGKVYRMGSSPIPGFLAMDSLILSLDAQYDLLPDKTAWIAYAAAIDGEWQLCANCQPDAAAKKLYRQYNFNRYLLGLAQVASPAGPLMAAVAFDYAVEYFPSPPPPALMACTRFGGDNSQLSAAFIQNGTQLASPALIWQPGNAEVDYDENTLPFAALLAYPNGANIPLCVSGPNGEPGLKATMAMSRP